MRINRAIGLGIALLVLQTLASGIWYSIESTVAAVAGFTQASLGAATHAGYAAPYTGLQ